MALGAAKKEETGYTEGGVVPVVEIKVEPAPKVFAPSSALVQIYGGTGTGRTTRALQAPGPIFYAHCAENWEGRLEQVAQETKVDMYNFGGIVDFSQGEAKAAPHAMGVWQAVSRKVVAAATSGKYRTVVVDTESALYEFLRLGEFGKIEQVRSRRYGPVNRAWARWVSALKGASSNGTNVILIATQKETYKNDKPTGVMTASTNKSSEVAAPVVLRTWYKKGKPGKFGVTIEKPWDHGELKWLELDGPMSEWGNLMALVTGTEKGVWGA